MTASVIFTQLHGRRPCTSPVTPLMATWKGFCWKVTVSIHTGSSSWLNWTPRQRMSREVMRCSLPPMSARMVESITDSIRGSVRSRKTCSASQS